MPVSNCGLKIKKSMRQGFGKLCGHVAAGLGQATFDSAAILKGIGHLLEVHGWTRLQLPESKPTSPRAVHLIHELIAVKVEDDAPAERRQSIEDFVEAIGKSDPKVV